MAVVVVHALVMIGVVKDSDDMALVGYDDIDFASATGVPLTSVRQPRMFIGATPVKVLLEEAADLGLERRTIVFQPELIIRARSVRH